MRIVKSYNSPCDEYIIRDIEAVYKALTSDDDCSFWYKDGYCNAPTNL